MVKTRLSCSGAVAANTFTEFSFSFNKGKNHLFLHNLNWVFDLTKPTDVIADDIISVQITGRSQAAIIPLGPSCYYRFSQMCSTNVGHWKLSDLVDLGGLMVKGIETLYVGVYSKTEGGTFSMSLLAGEQSAV